MRILKQFVPQEVCLKCPGCCRFKAANSVWAPCLLEEEIQGLVDKDAPAVSISADKKLMLVPHPNGEGYLCPFFENQTNKCKIYATRPFECQLYPFLLNLRSGKVLLTVDLNCPYVQEKLNSPEFKEYTGYLTEFLNSPAQKRLLKDNQQLLQAYEDVLEIIELDPEHEGK